jgi:hypothetical protein
MSVEEVAAIVTSAVVAGLILRFVHRKDPESRRPWIAAPLGAACGMLLVWWFVSWLFEKGYIR